MRRLTISILLWIIGWALALSGVRATVWADPPLVNAGLDAIVSSLSNTFDRSDDKFDQNRTYFIAAPYLNMNWDSGVSIFLRGDAQLSELSENGDTVSDDDEWDTELTNAYVGITGRMTSINLGLQPISLGNGLITYDDAPAADVSVSPGKWSLNFNVAQVLEESPVAGLSVAFQPDLFERIALFGAWFRDDEEAFAQTLPELYQLLEPTSKGTLWWAGLDAALFVGRVFLTATLIYEMGDIEFKHRSSETRRNVDAYLADLSLGGNFNDHVGLELFCFTASGDDEIGNNTLHAFVSPLPYNTRATIFFDPEWLDRNTQGALTYGGATVSGVVAPGLQLTYTPVEQVVFELTLTALYPHNVPDDLDFLDDSNLYGWEIDIQTIYSLSDNLDLILEAARFEHDTYFKYIEGKTPDPSILFSMGLNIHM